MDAKKTMGYRRLSKYSSVNLNKNYVLSCIENMAEVYETDWSCMNGCKICLHIGHVKLNAYRVEKLFDGLWRSENSIGSHSICNICLCCLQISS